MNGYNGSMKIPMLLALLGLGLVIVSCLSAPESTTHGLSAAELFERAARQAAVGRLGAAYEALELSFEGGFARPSWVQGDARFRKLLDAPEWRRRVYSLVEGAAREHRVVVVGPEERGERLVLTVRVVDEAGRALAGTRVGFVQTDADGYYQAWQPDEMWNPRWFAMGVTDADGWITAETIRPGYYAPEYEAPDELAHVHLDVVRPGFREFHGEVVFDDDPRLEAARRREVEAASTPIATVETGGGTARATVRLQLSR